MINKTVTHVKLEVFLVVKIHIMIVCIMMPCCGLVGEYQCFGGTF
jgi:hypothetical protein